MKEKNVNAIDYLRPPCSVPGCNKPAAQIMAKSSPRYPQYRRSNWIKDMYPQASDNFCCGAHHQENTARKHGVKTAGHLTAKRLGLTYSEYSAKSVANTAARRGFNSSTEYKNSITLALAIRNGFDSAAEYKNSITLALANRNGFSSTIEYRNSIHPYLKYRKDYCENTDGRLGFTCNTVLPTQEMIDAVGLVGWKPKQFLEVDHIDGNHRHNNPKNLQTLCKHCHVIKSFTSGDHRTPGRKTRGKDTNITNIYISDSTVNIKSTK